MHSFPLHFWGSETCSSWIGGAKFHSLCWVVELLDCHSSKLQNWGNQFLVLEARCTAWNVCIIRDPPTLTRIFGYRKPAWGNKCKWYVHNNHDKCCIHISIKSLSLNLLYGISTSHTKIWELYDFMYIENYHEVIKLHINIQYICDI